MQSLRYLRAINTDIKQLPGSVDMLRYLVSFQVGGRNLEAERSFSQRRVHRIESLSISISILSLAYCGLSEDDIPRNIGSLSNLRTLILSGNSFHCLPFDFSKLQFLEHLHLNDSENLQTLPSVSNLENLKYLELRNCQMLVKITGLDMYSLVSIWKIDILDCNTLQNPFTEGFFSTHAVSRTHLEILQVYVRGNEIPEWCCNKVTALSICFTMPKHKKDYKFLGMVLWVVCDFWNVSPDLVFFVAVANKNSLVFPWYDHYNRPKFHGEVSCVYYIPCITSSFAGEEITVKECSGKVTVKKMGIHLLYLDQHGDVTSLPAIVNHSHSQMTEIGQENKLSVGGKKPKKSFKQRISSLASNLS